MQMVVRCPHCAVGDGDLPLLTLERQLSAAVCRWVWPDVEPRIGLALAGSATFTASVAVHCSVAAEEKSQISFPAVLRRFHAVVSGRPIDEERVARVFEGVELGSCCWP